MVIKMAIEMVVATNFMNTNASTKFIKTMIRILAVRILLVATKIMIKTLTISITRELTDLKFSTVASIKFLLIKESMGHIVWEQRKDIHNSNRNCVNKNKYISDRYNQS